MKSLAALGGHYKCNQFIDGKGDAALSVFYNCQLFETQPCKLLEMRAVCVGVATVAK